MKLQSLNMLVKAVFRNGAKLMVFLHTSTEKSTH